MFYLRVGFLLALAIVLITVALANREAVTFALLPGDVSGLLGFSWSVTLPLYGLIFIAIVAGILIGFVWEWLREHRFRSTAARERRARERLEREMRDLKVDEAKGDDVLALLDGTGRG
ncbi:MAG: lipopolysaccharide assembly protein LapA domain-containing protein [Paracoccaceae bacterium]|nr:lipopolysaccharide assembly protein LapA domain-containing protein [Paracoccaceae bacterium]